jgi:ABC-type transport system involved in cytochrome c biogenesis permease subunit
LAWPISPPMSRVHGRTLSGEARGFDVVFPGAAGGGAATLGLWSTLARIAFVPQPRPAQSVARPARFSASESLVSTRPLELARPLSAASNIVGFLAALDACNLVVLQLGFWILGAGIVCGAIWADQSWGRPWGWDPKETFALITWIVYLIVVHVRVATNDKAWWTAVLSVLGFFVMLFNWIGVNFFLVGLHSYA